MVKLVYCFRKPAGMGHAEFSEYWEKTHGPLGARIPGLRKLVQSVALDPQPGRGTPDFDGMAELWFDDVESLLAARRSPEWKRATADEQNFIDPHSTSYFVTEERTVLER